MDTAELMIQIGNFLHGEPMQTEEQRALALEQAIQEQGYAETVDSSWISYGEYNPNARTLYVELLDGPSYIYYNVRPEIGEAFFEAASPGTFVNEVIKRGFFPYTRIE